MSYQFSATVVDGLPALGEAARNAGDIVFIGLVDDAGNCHVLYGTPGGNVCYSESGIDPVFFANHHRRLDFDQPWPAKMEKNTVVRHLLKRAGMDVQEARGKLGLFGGTQSPKAQLLAYGKAFERLFREGPEHLPDFLNGGLITPESTEPDLPATKPAFRM